MDGLQHNVLTLFFICIHTWYAFKHVHARIHVLLSVKLLLVAEQVTENIQIFSELKKL